MNVLHISEEPFLALFGSTVSQISHILNTKFHAFHQSKGGKH
jgi:hypothetical protein